MKPNLQTLSQREKLSKPSKYRAVPTFVGKVRFASKAEARRDGELQLLERAGAIERLVRQVRVPITVNGTLICTYVGDWSYNENGKKIVEDKKGVRTPAFNIKWKLCQALYPNIEWRLS